MQYIAQFCNRLYNYAINSTIMHYIALFCNRFHYYAIECPILQYFAQFCSAMHNSAIVGVWWEPKGRLQTSARPCVARQPTNFTTLFFASFASTKYTCFHLPSVMLGSQHTLHHFFALKIYVSSFASYQQRLQFSLSPTSHYHHSPFKSLQYHHCNSGQHTQLRQQTNAIVIIDDPHPKTSLFDLRYI